MEDVHGVMGVDGIWLDMIGERPQHELVEDTALIYVQVKGDLTEAPTRQILRVVIKLDNES